MLYIPNRNLNKQDINETDLENNEEIITCENPSDSIMFNDYKILSLMRSKIISLVGYGKAVKYESIIQYFTPDEVIRPVIDEIIENYVKEGLIESKFGYLFAGKGTLKEYLATNFDREKVLCTWLMFNGFTEEEISEAKEI